MRLSRGARDLLDLFRWFHRRAKTVFPSQYELAKWLKCSIRSVKRFVAELLGLGIIDVERRYRRSSVYRIVQDVPALVPIVVTPCSSSPRVYSKFESRETREEQRRKPPVMEESSMLPKPMEGFERFMGLFVAAGKPMNDGNVIRAQAAWSRLTQADKIRAFQDAERQLIRTLDPRWMPFPENYLAARSWTRTAPARSLPYIDPKTDKALQTHDEVLRLLKERGVA